MLYGYGNEDSTKRTEQEHRYQKTKCAELLFDEDMIATANQEEFLSNDKNKIKLISMLKNAFQKEEYVVNQSPDDADSLIINTAIENSTNNINWQRRRSSSSFNCFGTRKEKYIFFKTWKRQS